MVSAWCLKFCVLAIAIAGTLCARDPMPWRWQTSNSFDNDGLVGPPRAPKQFYLLENEFKTGQTVYLNATTVENEFRACLNIEYYLRVDNENDGIKLVLTDMKTGPSGIRTIWARYGFQGDVWQSETVDVKVAKGQFLQFQVNTVSGTVALAQFQYDNTFARCAFSALNTEFEEEPSNWNTDNVPANTFGENIKDHSSNSGKGKVAHLLGNSLIKPLAPLKAGTKCLTFWYMHLSQGKRIGTLTPTNIKVAVSTDKKPLWTSLDEFVIEDEWVRAQIPLNVTADGTLLTIQAEPRNGQSERGILLDDVVFSNRPCLPPVACNFEDSICGWTNRKDSKQNWILGRGRVEDRSKHTGATKVPTRLSTIYTDFTAKQDDGGVALQSDLIPKSRDHCAKIYIMHNRISADDIFVLEHLVKNESSTTRQPLWKLDTTNAAKIVNNDYNEEIHDVDVLATDMTSRLSLYARSKHPLSRMAVNEVQFREGKCKETPVSPTPGGWVTSKLNHEVLRVASELLKASHDNVYHLINDLIKNDDPIKTVCMKVLSEIEEALKQIEHNLKN